MFNLSVTYKDALSLSFQKSSGGKASIWIRRGYSILEMLVVVSILGLVLSIAVPSYVNFMAQKRIRSGLEDLYSHLRMAQSESLRLSSMVYVSFRPGSNWCYGLSGTSTCDCSAAGACLVDGVETLVRSSDYSGTPVTLAVTGLSGTAAAPVLIFQGNLGSVAVPGTFVFSASGLSGSISVNTKGLASMCSDTVSGYPQCAP